MSTALASLARAAIPAAILVAALAACGREPRAPRGGLGSPCLSNADCEVGACVGEGCTPDRPGRCEAPQICTHDIRSFCGCDGVTFSASSSCPRRRYASPSACSR